MTDRDSFIIRTSAALLAVTILGCATNQPVSKPTPTPIIVGSGSIPTAPGSAAMPAPAADRNPLLSEWTGPFGGVPQFDQVRVQDFKPGLDLSLIHI